MGLLVEGKWQDKWYDTKTPNIIIKFVKHWYTDSGGRGVSQEYR